MILLIIYMVLSAAFLLVLALANCAETAFTAASPAWIREKAQGGSKNAQDALYFIEHPDHFLFATLLNANLWSVCLVTVAQAAITAYVVNTPEFMDIVKFFGGDPHAHWDELVTSVSVTLVALIFAEILPKAIARTHANQMAMLLARPLRVSSKVMPFLIPVQLIMGASKYLIHFFGVSSTRKQTVSREDLRALATTMEKQGVVRGDIGDMLQSVLDMNEKRILSILVPLINIRSVSSTAKLAEVEAIASETGFQWIPVYKDRVDNFVGVINLHHVAEQLEGKTPEQEAAMVVADLMEKNLLFVPESMTLRDLHMEFNRRHGYMPAFVVNEFGGILGMVTRKDLVLSIAGWINNTRDKEKYSGIDRIAPNIFECSSRIDVREIEDEMGCEIDAGNYTTAAGLVMKLAGRIPVAGEEFWTEHYVLRVLESDGRSIGRLRFVTLDMLNTGD